MNIKSSLNGEEGKRNMEIQFEMKNTLKGFLFLYFSISPLLNDLSKSFTHFYSQNPPKKTKGKGINK